MSGVVEYIVSIKGMVDASIAKNMQAIAAAAQGMAAQVTAAESALNRWPKSMQGVANSTKSVMQQATAATQQATVAVQAHGRAMKAAGDAESLFVGRVANRWKSLRELRNYTFDEDRRLRARMAKEAEAGGGGSGGGFFAGLGGKMVNTYFGYQIAKGMVHGVDSAVSKIGDVEAMRSRLALSLSGEGGQATADRIYAKASELSGKYKNVSVLEGMKVIDDLRANLPESIDHVIDQAADPFVKMHGFLKSFEGGKHAGKVETAMKDIGAAIRAGELTGNMTGDLLKMHTEALTRARVVFGDKFKIQEYFQATQKAATALSAASDRFKYTAFPILTQSLGVAGGTAFQTLANNIFGRRVSDTSARWWREHGLVDESVLGPENFHTKGASAGQIKGSTLPGKRWLKNFSQWAQDPDAAIMEQFLPAAAKDIPGLKAAEMAAAWKAKDAGRLASLLEEFRKGEGNMERLISAFAGATGDRNAAKTLEEFVMRAPSTLKAMERLSALNADMAAFETYDKAKQALAAQSDRLLQSVTGKDFIGNVNKALDTITNFMSGLADKMTARNQFPLSSELFSGLNGGDGDVPWWWKMPTALGGHDLKTDWDGAQRDWLGRIKESLAQPGFNKEIADYGRLPDTGPVSRFGFGSGMQSSMAGAAPSSQPAPQSQAAAAQAQKVQVESRVQVQTSFSPVTISPGTLTVTYNGPIQGPAGVPVNGSGGQPRGQATPSTGTGTAGAAAP